MSELRHIKHVCIPAPMMERLVREGATTRCMRGVPADARLIGMGPDILRDGFTFMFEHPSFPLADLGCFPVVEWVAFEQLTETDAEEMRVAEAAWPFTVRYGP